MKAIHALLLLGIAGYAMAMTTDSSMTQGPPGMVPGGAPGGAPPQLPGGLEVNANGVNMRDVKALDPASLRSSVASMSQSEQDTVCQGYMNGGADKSAMANLAAAGVDCFGAMTRDASFRPDPAQALQTLALKRESTPPSNWGTSDWSTAIKQMPDAVTASDLRQMSSATMRSLIQAGDLQSTPGAFSDPSKKRALETQMKSAYGQPSAWTNDTLREMGSLLGDMDRDTLKAIPADQMRAAASSFKDLSFDDPGKKAAIGNQLVEGLGKNNAASWSKDDVVNADQFIRNNPAIISQLSDAALTSSVSDLGARSTDKRGAAQLGKRLKAMSGFSDPTAVDSSKVAQMGHLMQGMGRDYLSKLPTAAISGAISTLANVSFPRGEARELMAKVKGTPSSYDAAKVREMGNLMTGLEPADFDQIPAMALADTIDDIKDKDFDVSQCRAIVAKVKSAGVENVKKMGMLMSKCMTPDDVDNVSIDDLGLNCSSSTGPTFTPDKATAKKMFAKIKARFGSPANNANYTLTCMKNWGRVAALGMDAMDFENLPDNGDLGSIFEQLANNEADMDDFQTKAIATRARTFLQMDNDTAVMAHDSAVIEQVGKFMKHFNDSDLSKFNTTVKPNIAQKIGKANLDNLPQTDIVRMKTFSLQNVLRDDTGAVTDRSGASTLDDNDIREMGNVFRGMETADVNKVTGAAFSSNVNNMQDKIRGMASQKAVIDRISSEDATFFDSSDNVISSAGLVGGMDSAKVNAMNSSVLGEALTDAATQMEARSSSDMMRDKAGFSGEVSSADMTSMSTNKQGFVQKAFEGYQAAQSSSSNRRKRRNTVATTCTDITVLGSNAVSLTTTQIESLTTSEFTDCTETLGAITGWSSTQMSSLATEAKAAYNSTVSTWSANNVQLIGTMLAGLTSAEIGTLALSTASTLSVAGTSTSFSSAQLMAAFGQFLSTAKSNTASSVTGSELMSLGAFACGASTTQIAAFTSANYKTAASSIGSQTQCDSSQLEAYAALAKTAYGASSTWDSTTITTVGNVIGGLSTTEIAALTSTQISSIATTTIAAIPTTKFSSFSSTQLSGFSTAQANSVTADQQNSLGSTQLASLVSAGATDQTTGNGAGAIRASILFMLPLLALFL